jgi:NADPH:quinone reductase-like Zn-dependent oxidoreductase
VAWAPSPFSWQSTSARQWATTTSTANVDLVSRLGADVVVDDKKEDFSHVLRNYDVVLNSLDKAPLEKSVGILKPGGQLISISGPPDAAFAKIIGASWIVTTEPR